MSEETYRAYRIFTTGDTGKTWVTTPDGSQFFATSPEEARRIVDEDLEDLALGHSFNYRTDA